MPIANEHQRLGLPEWLPMQVLEGGDCTKDIDFTRSENRGCWKAGFEHANKVLHERPWEKPVHPPAGIVLRESANLVGEIVW